MPQSFWSSADRCPGLPQCSVGSSSVIQLPEERVQCGDADVTEGEIDIAVAGQVPQHVGEHAYVEAAVDLVCQREHFFAKVGLTRVDEVASRAAIEQGDDLAGELVRCERRFGDARTRRSPRCGVQDEIDE